MLYIDVDVLLIKVHCPLSFSAECSYYITDRQGTLSYPSSGGSYLPTQTCQWVLEGAVGSRLQIQVCGNGSAALRLTVTTHACAHWILLHCHTSEGF